VKNNTLIALWIHDRLSPGEYLVQRYKRWFFTTNRFCSEKKDEKSFTMSARTGIIRQILEKTIAGVVIRRSMEAGPQDQLFIVFTDNTYLEFYGTVGWSTSLEVGDLETAKHYAAHLGGNVEVIF
jgi:hypothetical protein